MGLDTVELVMAVEEEFGITISDEEAQDIRTVGDMYQCVLRKVIGTQRATRTSEETWAALASVIKTQTGVSQFTKDSRFVEDLMLD